MIALPDTGAEISIISKSVLDKVMPKYKLNKCKFGITTFSNQRVKPLGQIVLPIEIEGKNFNNTFAVVKTKRENVILGVNFIDTNKLNIDYEKSEISCGGKKLSQLLTLTEQQEKIVACDHLSREFSNIWRHYGRIKNPKSDEFRTVFRATKRTLLEPNSGAFVPVASDYAGAIMELKTRGKNLNNKLHNSLIHVPPQVMSTDTRTLWVQNLMPYARTIKRNQKLLVSSKRKVSDC